MKTALLLRIASILTLLFAIGHSMGAADSWSPVGETDVLRAMKTHRFDTMRVSRTYWDFYFGFGLIISVALLLQAVLLWQLAGIARTDPGRVRAMMASFCVASLMSAALSWKFIFAVPAMFSIAIAVCLALALLRGR